ncbi:MAG TPA: acyl carrier protein phosphodiesterase [Cytophagaceae bacterium]|nr:acyl carrier protein phosphodiesterase [Cytophagaceae bacterium]
MNHLINLYLSRNLGEKMLGCLIGEIVRTSNFDKYTQGIIDGIELNKKIALFVKDHPVYERSRAKLNPKYSKHSSKIIDIFYDHFLAANWSKYSNESLEQFAKESYQFIEDNHNILPYKLRKLIAVMINNNWLVNYSSVQGVHSFMREITRRDTFQTNLEYSLEDLINHYNEFKADFEEIFPQMIQHVQELIHSEELVLQEVYR